jgi:hypothetical protein
MSVLTLCDVQASYEHSVCNLHVVGGVLLFFDQQEGLEACRGVHWHLGVVCAVESSVHCCGCQYVASFVLLVGQAPPDSLDTCAIAYIILAGFLSADDMDTVDTVMQGFAGVLFMVLVLLLAFFGYRLFVLTRAKKISVCPLYRQVKHCLFCCCCY